MHASSPAAAIEDPQPAARGWSALWLGLLGSLLSYLAHPPFGWSMLAWIGPVPWLLAARSAELHGRRPYRALWLAGFAFWLATVQWIRLPHPANILFLFMLSGYLGVYLPIFVAITRVAVHRVGVPLWLAAPVAWTGLEWLRARLLTGFLMASAAHTQVNFPTIIQVVDVFGEYGVTFLILLVAASIAETVHAFFLSSKPGRPRPGALLKLTPAIFALAAAYAYGHYKLLDYAIGAKLPRTATVALIQSDMLADWKGTAERDAVTMEQMFQLSQQAVKESKAGVDLVVWPETMYRDPLMMLDPEHGPPTEMFDLEELDATRRGLAEKAAALDAALLVGIDRWSAVAADKGPDSPHGYRIEPFNSSACVDRTGTLVGTYDKMHLLPFGEYTPFEKWLPFVRRFTPITGAAVAGRGATACEVEGVVYSPSICYETVLPHLIRRQFVELAERGKAPDVLVNLTNDAWYWGSSELDMHLASGVFRAVEMRTPLVISANRGLSAYVDYCGRVVNLSQRDVPAAVVAEVVLPPRNGAYRSLFAAYGDWLPLVCLGCCMMLTAVGWRTRARPD